MFLKKHHAAAVAMLAALASPLAAEIHVGADDALKAVLQKTQPEYPAMAKQMHITGRVDVEVTIDTDGSVAEVRVVSGNALLTPAVTSALKKWKFSPFTADGAPTKAVAPIGFDFKN